MNESQAVFEGVLRVAIYIRKNEIENYYYAMQIIVDNRPYGISTHTGFGFRPLSLLHLGKASGVFFMSIGDDYSFELRCETSTLLLLNFYHKA